MFGVRNDKLYHKHFKDIFEKDKHRWIHSKHSTFMDWSLSYRYFFYDLGLSYGGR